MITTSQLAAATGCPAARAARWQPHMATAMERFGINTPKRQAHFLGQLGHESSGLSRIEENLNYSAARLLEVFPSYFTRETAADYARKPEKIANRVYANRMGNGSERSGHGWSFRGRSPVQLTGLENYLWIGKLIGLPLHEQPNLALELETGSLISAAYWHGRGMNTLADTGDTLRISRKLNLGNANSTRMPNGLQDRIQRTNRALAALGGAA